MFGTAWITLKLARAALAGGYLDEAQRLLSDKAVRGHKQSWPLLSQLAQGYVARAEKKLNQGDSAGAWADLANAEAVAPAGHFEFVGKLRQDLATHGLAEARKLLEAGEPRRAAETIGRLRDQRVNPADWHGLEDAAKDWLLAQELADRGEFIMARQMFERVLRYAPPAGAVQKYQTELNDRQQLFNERLLQLHDAHDQRRLRDVLQLADEVLAVAPEHAEARKVRAKAWKRDEPETIAGHYSPEDSTPAEPAAPPKKFHLWIDGVGGYLICMAPRISLGQASAEGGVDVPLMADLSRFHAAIVRDNEGYVVESTRPLQVNGLTTQKATLICGDRLTVGIGCQFVFRRPVPASASARLELQGGQRLPLSLDAVILMAETLIIGPGPQAHIIGAHLAKPIVLYRHKDGLGVRYPDDYRVDGQPAKDRQPLGFSATVSGPDFNLASNQRRIVRNANTPADDRHPEGTMKFTYGTGQRPLDGYTIKRGVGKGGFGEVYFAVSDGGKEVALKLLRGDAGIELRGIAHCINLKHQNLVAVYDLKNDSSGNQWVVMEYVSGEALHTVLDRHANGLPRELTREWFLALAREVGYLHDHGIVHRDLKPANVFLEDGVIKVGDYGLCKSISSSQHAQHTQSIGTVHYMAPEISKGNYNRQIDIYACGILLYEMITGTLPFEGESPGEVLMKHMLDTPDLNKLPEELRSVVGKALAKDPVNRYSTMAEMAQALEAVLKPSSSPAPAFAPTVARKIIDSPTVPEVRLAPRSKRGLIGELAGSLGLSAILALLTTTFWAAIGNPDGLSWIASTYFLTVAVSWAVLVPTKFWPDRVHGDAWGRRMTLMGMGAGVGLLALWLDGWNLNPKSLGVPMRYSPSAVDFTLTKREALTTAAGYVSYFALALGLVRWWRFTERRRKSWFGIFPVLAAGVMAFLLTLVLDVNGPAGHGAAAAIATAAALVQLVSPHDPAPSGLPKRLRYKVA